MIDKAFLREMERRSNNEDSAAANTVINVTNVIGNGEGERSLCNWATEEFISYTEKGKRILDRVGAAKYILDAFNAKVSISDKYMYIYNSNIGTYNIDYKAHSIETMVHNMFGNNITTDDINMIKRKAFHIPKHYCPSFIDEFEHPGYICFRNGVYDIEAKERIDHSPDMPFISSIPWDYDPDAKCPNIDIMMPQIFDDKQILDEYEWGGYVLTPGNRFKKIKVYLGETDSGKSTYFRLYERLVGASKVTPVEPHSMHKEFYMSLLHGMTLNMCGDVGGDTITGFNRFKQLSGEDTILANVKNGAMITFRNPSKSMWATNILAPVDDSSMAAYNRLLLTMCGKVISPENNTDYRESDMHTDEEMSGVINHMLLGLERLEKRKGFDLPDLPTRKAQYDAAVKGMFLWADNSVIFTGYDGDRTDHVDLYNSYVKWAESQNIIVIGHDMFIEDFKRCHNKNYIKYGRMTIGKLKKTGVSGVLLRD